MKTLLSGNRWSRRRPAFHAHALADGIIEVVNEDGTSEMHRWETGHAYWLPASQGLKRHADVNTGSKAIEVMVVELKKATASPK